MSLAWYSGAYGHWDTSSRAPVTASYTALTRSVLLPNDTCSVGAAQNPIPVTRSRHKEPPIVLASQGAELPPPAVRLAPMSVTPDAE
jgi:hypothetical protein